MKYYKVNGGILATKQNVDGEEINADTFKKLKEQLEIPTLSQEEQEEIEKNTPPTDAERLEALETAFMEFVGVMMNG